jgi:hypothetical protein
MLDGCYGLEVHKNVNGGWEGLRLLKAYDEGHMPMLLLKSGVLKRQHLLPR